MGIEIKELYIKAVVAPEPAHGTADRLPAAALEKIKKEIIRECLQELKAILNEQKER
jgi:hypothetical protein